MHLSEAFVQGKGPGPGRQGAGASCQPGAQVGCGSLLCPGLTLAFPDFVPMELQTLTLFLAGLCSCWALPFHVHSYPAKFHLL